MGRKIGPAQPVTTPAPPRRRNATPAIAALVALVTIVLLIVALSKLPIRPESVLASCRKHPAKSAVRIQYPLARSLFPPEIAAPTVRWRDENRHSTAWVLSVVFGDRSDSIIAQTARPAWQPSPADWDRIKEHSIGREVRVTVAGIQRRIFGNALSCGAVTFGVSADSAGAPIFYREVILPFIEAVKDPAQITWRFGAISSPTQPPAVLKNLPVCGNCHSFSRDGSVLGMDVDYANDKGAYAVVETGREITLSKDVIISWADFRRADGELTFGLLSSVSPDGRYVLSTVKDRSVFIPRPDLTYSQLFFPIKGILVAYDRVAKKFAPLPGADDKRFVQSNPQWSPDGKEVLFIKSEAYTFLGKSTSVLLSPEDEKAFFKGRKEFKYDIYRVPFNNGKGGVPQPLTGASGNGMSNYFPRYSPDGKWIVFCQARNYSLLQPDSRLFIIPAQGGTPRLMRCNSDRMNSWHSWSPNGKWLVFSSKVNGPYTQLFLTHVDENGDDTPPVLLENFTAADRAANIPEFVNLAPGAIASIKERFIDDNSFSRKGMDQAKVGDFVRSEQSFLKAIALNPKNAGAHASLGILYSQQNREPEAIAHFAVALELDPKNGAAHYNLGIWSEKHGNLDSAIIRYRTSIECDPANVEAYNNLGYALARTGQTAEAEKYFRKALEINPYLERVKANLEALRKGALK